MFRRKFLATLGLFPVGFLGNKIKAEEETIVRKGEVVSYAKDGFVFKEVEKNGRIKYFDSEGLLHREDGPAVECGTSGCRCPLSRRAPSTGEH
jgi:hypothetical protein